MVGRGAETRRPARSTSSTSGSAPRSPLRARDGARPRRLPRRARRERRSPRPGRRSLRRRRRPPDDVGGDERRARRDRRDRSRRASTRAWWSRATTARRATSRICRASPACSHGSGDARIVYRLGENRLEADLLTDGKTGGFLDQADNQAALAALAPAGRAGARRLHLPRRLRAGARRGGAGAVLAIDESDAAVGARRRQRAPQRPRQPRASSAPTRSTSCARSRARGERFDVVVIDPPALAKRGGDGGAGHRRARLQGAASCAARASPGRAACSAPAPARAG